MTEMLRFFSEEERAALQKIAQKIKNCDSVAIVTHMRPDGDAYGSSLALAEAIRSTGKICAVCDETPVPENLVFLPETADIQNDLPLDYGLYIACDCADVQRMGQLSAAFQEAEKRACSVNIDHHVSNTRFAKENFVRVCSANCMNVLALIETLDVPLTERIANLLMTGLLTDSGCFSHDDVSEETFAAAARLVSCGADVCALQYRLFKKQSKERALLHGQTMSKMRFDFDDRFAYIVVTREAMETLGAPQSATEGFVDFPLSVDSVEICASILEVKKNQYKIALRSKSYADVNRLAATFGGGGHVRAAGCMLNGNLYEVIDKLSYAVSQYLRD